MKSLYELIHGTKPVNHRALTFFHIPYFYDRLNTQFYPAWRQHDQDYASQINRKEADMIMRDTIISLSDSFLGVGVAYVAYTTVRIFGAFFYYADR